MPPHIYLGRHNLTNLTQPHALRRRASAEAGNWLDSPPEGRKLVGCTVSRSLIIIWRIHIADSGAAAHSIKRDGAAMQCSVGQLTATDGSTGGSTSSTYPPPLYLLEKEDFDSMYRRVPASLTPAIRTASNALPYAVTERGNVTSTMCQN